MILFRSAIALILLATLALAPAADEPGGVVLPGDSRSTGGKLDVARAHLAEGKTADAIALLQSLIDTSGNDLVPVGEGRSVSARTLCHAMLARLDKVGLARYRARADTQARRLLEQAERDGDVAQLHRVIDESFCSTATPEALDRLGDAAFERGRFEEAEGWWRLFAPLTPPRKGDIQTLDYPDPSADAVARTRAKQILACIFRLGSDARADLDAFRALHPKDAGALAGRRGLYADTLDAVAAERARPPSSVMGDWPTFGGDASRGRIVPAPSRLLDKIGQFCRAGPTWAFGLEQRARFEGSFAQELKGPPLDAARALAFHPIVVGHHAVVADAQYITAFDLRTGKAEQWYDAEKFVGGFVARFRLPAIADLRYTLTAGEGALFARLGTQTVRDIRPVPRKPFPLAPAIQEAGNSVLVSLKLTRGPDGRVTGTSPAWLVHAVDLGRKEHAVFEGAPVVHEGRVFLAATRFEGGRVVTAVHCYPAQAEDAAPAPLWRADVCETNDLGDGEPTNKQRYRHHLLTLAGSRLVYCSHSGAIVALDPHTGRRAWALRYPRRDTRDPADQPSLRDLAPAVFASGRVYVAPADSDRLYCLDPYTGAIHWERDRLDVVHLVGVGQGRLIFTTWRNPRQGLLHPGGLRAVMADDGSDKGGWSLPDDGGGLLPMGRPILVGDLVLWPTARPRPGVFAVRQEDGLQADNPTLLHGIPSGNLVYANGCLLVADPKYLWAFVPPEMLADEEANVGGESSLRRARASANLGKTDEALARLAECEKSSKPERLREEVRHERRRALADAVERAIVAKKADEAERWMKQALVEATPRERLAVLLQSARAWEKVGDKERAKAAWEEVAGSPDLAEQMVRDDAGLPQRAAWLARRASCQLAPPGRTSWQLVLRKDLELSVRLSLAADERFLAVPGTDHLWTARPREVFCRTRKTGSVAWKASLAFTPTWGRSLDDLFLVAGTDGLAALDGATGKRLWSFAAPKAKRYPSDDRVPLDEAHAQPLADFHLDGARLLVTQGQRRLLCLDARSGAVLWGRWAPGAGFDMPAPRGRFLSVYPVGNDRLLVQSTTKCWQVDARNGQILDATPSRLRAPWPRTPLTVGNSLICHISDPDRVQLLDVAQGKIVWTYTPPGRWTRNGTAPIVLDAGGELVVVEPVNLGARVQKLDRATGKPLWPQPPLLNVGEFASSAWLATAEILYHAASGQLSAWSLASGKLLWRKALLGEGTWRLEQSGKTVLAWLDRSAAIQFRFRWLAGSLQWHVGPLPSSSPWAVSCLDADTGDLLQRLSLDPEWLPRERSSDFTQGISLLPMAGVDRHADAVPGPTVVRDRLGFVLAVGNCVKAFHVIPSTK